jgi:hypothetical protein
MCFMLHRQSVVRPFVVSKKVMAPQVGLKRNNEKGINGIQREKWRRAEIVKKSSNFHFHFEGTFVWAPPPLLRFISSTMVTKRTKKSTKNFDQNVHLAQYHHDQCAPCCYTAPFKGWGLVSKFYIIWGKVFPSVVSY